MCDVSIVFNQSIAILDEAFELSHLVFFSFFAFFLFSHTHRQSKNKTLLQLRSPLQCIRGTQYYVGSLDLLTSPTPFFLPPQPTTTRTQTDERRRSCGCTKLPQGIIFVTDRVAYGTGYLPNQEGLSKVETKRTASLRFTLVYTK